MKNVSYTSELSSFAITMAEIISANVCGEIIERNQLSSDRHFLGDFICSTAFGENATDIQLDAIDKLLTKNAPELKGVIYLEYNDAVAFRSKQPLLSN